jgi:succinoglycan biosynthesis transport protein ExoP
MNNPETNYPPRLSGIHDYLEIGLRRKWYIIVPLVVSILVSFGLYRYLPKVYSATALILVQPQSIPENYVRPTITDTVSNRLDTIAQQIMSRTLLENVIQQFNLYGDLRKKVSREEVVETMRKAIQVKIEKVGEENKQRTRNIFTISFQGEEPTIVMMVTNKLASMVIEENLKVRELQAGGASEFINVELSTMEDRLKSKEHDIRMFKERSIGELPQQLDANLRILEQLQQQLRTTSEKIKAAEDRSIIFRSQMEQLKKLEPRENPQSISEDPSVTQLETLKRELASMQTRLKEAHPDVIDLKKKVAELESQVEGRAKEGRPDRKGTVVRNLSPPRLDSDTERLYREAKEQYENAVLEVKRLNREENDLKKQIGLYQRRIENTPKREQELVLLTRDYDMLKANYQSLLDKNLQAEMAENLERKQKGEQFIILDPAIRPEKPIKPNGKKILLMGGFLGIMLGIGLTFLRESLDQSFRTVPVVEGNLGIPVVAALPNLREGKVKAESSLRILAGKTVLINGKLSLEELMDKRRPHQGKEEPTAGGKLPVVIVEPDTFSAEEFRKLIAQIFLRTPNPPRSILVTSAVPGEGKTLVAVNLALAISQEIHKKAILIDGDLRKPLTHLEEYPNSKGLTDYLSNQTPLSEVLLNSNAENLQIIPAGSSTEKSAGLLGSKKMSELLMSLREFRDDTYVIIDSPPILSASDPTLLSKLVDGIVLVVMGNRTSEESIQRAIRSIDRQKIIGIVFNQIDIKPSSYYYSKRYPYYRYNKK